MSLFSRKLGVECGLGVKADHRWETDLEFSLIPLDTWMEEVRCCLASPSVQTPDSFLLCEMRCVGASICKELSNASPMGPP